MSPAKDARRKILRHPVNRDDSYQEHCSTQEIPTRLPTL